MNSRLGVARFTANRSGKYAVRTATALAAGALGFLACEAFGGHPGGDAPAVVPPTNPLCLGTCLPDPGWAAVDPAECNAAITLDKLPIVGFDDLGSTGYAVAADMYTYVDATVSKVLFEFTTSPSVPANPSTLPGPANLSTVGFQPPTVLANFCGPGEATPVPVAQNNRGAAPGGNYVLHLLGGFVPAGDHYGVNGDSCFLKPAPFRGYGGGIGISMQKLNNRDQGHGDSQNSGDNNNRQYCMSANMGPGARPEVCPPMDAEYAVRVAALDVSAYDGVSFWARRGPNGQIGIHVLVGDKYTDDDLSYLTYRNDPTAPRHCERIRQCSCSNHKECQFSGGPPEYPGCLLPGNSPPPACPPFNIPAPASAPGGPGYYCLPFDAITSGLITINGQGTTTFCQSNGSVSTDPNLMTICNAPYPAYPNDGADGGYIGTPCGSPNTAGITSSAGIAGDRQFWGKPCTPYTFSNGTAASYCFDPDAGEAPADPTQQCGDHWTATVDLSTDWQFYKVPFTDMRQQGWAKKAEQIDLHSVSIVRFTWDTGWVDYWIDDVSFYREPK